MGQKKVTLPPTEIVDPAGRDFDRLPVSLQLERLLASQAQAVEAIRKITDQLAAAVEAATDRLRGSEGRLVYAGAGCSIRIGVQDGVELVPTFGWPLNRLIYLIAGGAKALAELVEGAEDDVDDDTSYYFSALHNEYIDEELRYKDEYGKLGATGVTTADLMLTDRIRHDAETRFREETRTITALRLNWNFNLNLSS